MEQTTRSASEGRENVLAITKKIKADTNQKLEIEPPRAQPKMGRTQTRASGISEVAAQKMKARRTLKQTERGPERLD